MLVKDSLCHEFCTGVPWEHLYADDLAHQWHLECPQEGTSVLSFVVVSATSPLSNCSTSCESTRVGITKCLVADSNYVCVRCNGKAWPSKAQLWLQWISMVSCLMWRLLSANWVTCVWTVRMTLLPKFVWPGEGSENSWLSLSPDTFHLRYAARCKKPYFAQACPMVTEHGTPLTCSSSTTRIMPWSAQSVASKPETKHFQLHCYSNWEFGDITAVLHSRQLRWYGNVQRTTSRIKTVTDFPIPARGRGRPRKTWSEFVKIGVSN